MIEAKEFRDERGERLQLGGRRFGIAGDHHVAGSVLQEAQAVPLRCVVAERDGRVEQPRLAQPLDAFLDPLDLVLAQLARVDRLAAPDENLPVAQ